MTRFVHLARVLIVGLAILALLPVARLGLDWLRVERMDIAGDLEMTDRGFDWVHWQERDGMIYADYVHPNGPAGHAGLQKGDVFFMLDYQQFFSVEALKGAVAGVRPGSVHTYSVQRGDQIVETDVRFTRYPTFLFPLSRSLWQFSLWGFFLGALAHIVGIVIVGPLAGRSRQARWSLLLIVVSALWIFGNLLRLLMVEMMGPPIDPGSLYDQVFQGLSFVGLVGWIGFPVLLLQHVLVDARRVSGESLGITTIVVTHDLVPAEGDGDDHDAYTLEYEQIHEKIAELSAIGGTQILMQGGVHPDLRHESSAYTADRPFFGTAIGGSLGADKAQMYEVVSYCMPHVHPDRPVHLLGIGGIRDIFEGVRLGIDTFDCVQPTRVARHGWALLKGRPGERINLRNARFRDDPAPIDETCGCETCQAFSRGYLHHLLKAGELLAITLITTHNVFTMNRLMRDVREAIAAGTLDRARAEWLG